MNKNINKTSAAGLLIALGIIYGDGKGWSSWCPKAMRAIGRGLEQSTMELLRSCRDVDWSSWTELAFGASPQFHGNAGHCLRPCRCTVSHGLDYRTSTKRKPNSTVTCHAIIEIYPPKRHVLFSNVNWHSVNTSQ